MGLETGSFIADLVASNPIGASDPKSQGDDHIRLIKAVLLGSFPNVNGAVTATPAALNLTVTLNGFTTGNFVRKSAGGIEQRTPAEVRADIGADNADNLASGTVPDARFPATLPAVSGANLTNLNASNVASGELADARLSSNVPLKNANNVFTAGATGANGTTFSAGLPGFWLVETDAGADGQQWRVSANAGLFNISTFNDARSASAQAFAAQRSGNTVTSARLYAAGSVQLTSQDHGASPATTGAQVRHSDDSLYDVGLNVMPSIATDGATRTVLHNTHIGKLTVFTGTTCTWTIAPSPQSGYTMNGANAGSGNITLDAAGGQTLTWLNGSGSLSTGSRTIAPGGVFTIWARSSTQIYVWGTGIS